MRRIPMKMKDWVEKLDGFLKLNDRNILEDAGKTTHELAVEMAEKEYDKFNKKRNKKSLALENDFDKAIKLIEKKKKEKS
jgi:hypothetical protein